MCGGVPEWPKGADCKSVVYDFDGSNPSPSIIRKQTQAYRFKLGFVFFVAEGGTEYVCYQGREGVMGFS